MISMRNAVGAPFGFAAILTLSTIVYCGQPAAQDQVPAPEDMVSGLLPDEAAQGVFKSWKGIKRKPKDKAENDKIPSFTLYVTFEYNSDELTTDGEFLLSQAGLALIDKRLRKYSFFLAGHTDAVGSDEYNMALSQRRAARVRNYLVDEFKITTDRLVAQGYGESRLLLPDSPEADANRRVEIKNIGPKE